MRGTIIESTLEGKRIKVGQLIHGTIIESEFILRSDQCTIFFGELEEGKEYIFAINEYEGKFSFLGCAISYLKIENEKIVGRIAPGIMQIDYNDIFGLKDCGEEFALISLKNNLEIYPNPTADIVSIRNTNSEKEIEYLQIRVFDSFGKIVSVHKRSDGILPEDQWSLSLKELAAGLYFIEISNGTQVETCKVIKQ